MLRKIALPVVVIAAAIGIANGMTSFKKPAEKKVFDEKTANVSVVEAQAYQMVFPVLSSGVVESKVDIRLIAEVSGKIIEVSPKWVEGGFFREGEEFFAIEDQNYVNQLAKAEASLASARSALTQEQALAHVAKSDWEKRKSRTDEQNLAAKSLALREPQLASALAQLRAAEADVASAKKALEKTRFKAPFDGILVKKAADNGQFIAAGNALGEFRGVDTVKIRIPLSASQQSLLALPDIGESSDIAVELSSDSDKSAKWQGKLIRTEGVLDERTKVLYGVIEVKDPYGLDSEKPKPLRLGMYVNVSIASQSFDAVIEVPRKSIRKGDKVWLIDQDNKMQLVDVNYLPVRHDNLFIVSGVNNGDRVLVGGVADPQEGKLVNAQTVDFNASGKFIVSGGNEQ